METIDAAELFTALGQTTRLDLIRALLAAGPTGLPAGDIAAQLGVAASTLSFHLRALEQAELIVVTRYGRSLVYAANLERLRDLLAYLAGACCGFSPVHQAALGTFLDTLTAESRPMATDPFNVLFLCTRNSARSIMAEAILNKIGGQRFRAISAGSAPAEDGPLPEVLAQLKAMGHDVSTLRSKSWDEFIQPGAPQIDFVIALCDTLSGQVCPDFGTSVVTASWPLPDPAKFAGSAAERATLLNELYASLRRRLEIFINLPIVSLNKLSLQAKLDELADPHALAR
ncbi:protein-tyrosine-phosphatase [Dongia mobilis]|uniref:Protein-tyrosine-phosphatase n=1 Tax=Dongia mobilis TaxID=578943 RepID=A0A4R6WVP5_9PROT|nr:metalloregulator ArsR/SmtB family transcription factor [Dongia mobilis]TDQ84094.1 protein-tyrosine-phosphatase [Dongia mobilis]